jgi:transcriptional regulator with XRE-family HTH domain
MSDIGKRLREARERIGYDQARFGALGGVSRNSQSNYEKGLRAPDADYLLGLHAAGVDLTFVLSGSEASDTLSPDETAIVQSYRRLGPAQRQAVAELLGTMTGTGAATVHEPAAKYRDGGPK